LTEKQQALIRYAGPGDLSVCSEWDDGLALSLLEYKLANKDIILAERNGNLVGYMRLEHLWSKVPYMGLIRVSPVFRNRGIGSELVRFACGQLLKQGHSYLYSSSQVNEEDPQAWHRKVGFEECGLIAGVNEGGIGEVFFRLKLGQN
jgi:ribosomal protein S18 acetylase RimI-like enzyme